MGRPTLHIVVSCTERKRVPVPRELRLRSVGRGTVEDRAGNWLRRLEAHANGQWPAREVYAGEHWALCRALPGVAHEAGFKPFLWVASAGYGLLPADGTIAGYSATFAVGQPDSVADTAAEAGSRSQNQAWWTELAARRRKAGRASCLADLAARDRKVRLLVIGSPAYVGAIEADLLVAMSRLHSSSAVVIVTSKVPSGDSALVANHVCSSARLLSRVGGTRIGLHARVAADVLRTSVRIGFDGGALREHYERVAARCPPAPTFDRRTMTDDEVRRFIHESSVATYSAALRTLRQSGYACEQKRFRHLFQTIEAPS